MVESIGIQQVLQLSAMVERAQIAQQNQGSDLARAFDKELKKLDSREADMTHPVEETSDEVTVREDGERKSQARMRDVTKKAKETDEDDEKSTASESGQGKIINVVA